MAERSHIDIHVPFPDARSPQLSLELAACRVTISPSDGQAWVTGVYDDLAGVLPLHIQQDGSTLRLAQHETLAETLRLKDHLATLDLALGRSQPFGLILEAGLLEGRVDLSGLPLTWLEVKPGQGKLEIFFKSPNPQLMQALNIRAGSAHLEVRDLANANFASLNVDGGQVDCLLDFSGELQRPAQGKITIPQGSIEIQVPATTSARIAVETFGAVDPGDGFIKKAGSFWNQAALAGQGPVLALMVTVLQGTIRLHSY